MTLALVSLGIVSLLELSLWLPPFWNARKLFARILLAALWVASAALLVERLAAWTILLAILSLYRVINLERVAAGRIQTDYLFHASRKTALWLMGVQLLILVFAGLGYHYRIDPIRWWYGLAILQLGCAAILLSSLVRHLRTTKRPGSGSGNSKPGLPSLTVAIPARNETTDLEACLQTLAASTYPKLEILVLDDCSQDKRTPEIIRGFAHDGVRFIAGTNPPNSWLAKNHAYAQLAAEANSELLLFCGVDCRFEPESLTILVKTLLQKQKTMISILPRNVPAQSKNILSRLIQPSRYGWELALPRRLLQRPPVLSTCWLITRQALDAAGGFQAVRRKGVPESYLARFTASSGDGYSFLQSDQIIGVTSQKLLEDQKATAIRTRYLQLHRRPELTAFVSLAELSMLVWPVIILAVAATTRQPFLAAISGLSFLATTVMYMKLINLTYRRITLQGIYLLPIAALYDIGLLNYSMWQYEFREVLWKGRNVCIPIMRVIPSLPKL